MIVATRAISIDASPDRIWDALTVSSEISRAMFEATVESDWQQGGVIMHRGLDGRLADERCVILDIDPPLFLRVGYTTVDGGPAIPAANGNTIAHALSRDGKRTRLTVTHRFDESTHDAQDRAEADWAAWLAAVKQMIES